MYAFLFSDLAKKGIFNDDLLEEHVMPLPCRSILFRYLLFAVAKECRFVPDTEDSWDGWERLSCPWRIQYTDDPWRCYLQQLVPYNYQHLYSYDQNCFIYPLVSLHSYKPPFWHVINSDIIYKWTIFHG